MSKISIIYPLIIDTISPNIYGHFAEHLGGVIYDGIYVGKDASVANVNGFRKFIIDKLKAINAPVIRWPGGCFAEMYDWRDGIGVNRPTKKSIWTKATDKYETNEVGLHEFVDFCENCGAKPYFATNVLFMDIKSTIDLMDYCFSPRGASTLALEREKNGHPEPFDITYWGIGNENWGDGGNMRPEFYADLYRIFSNSVRRFSEGKGNNKNGIEIYAGGANASDYNWTHKFMSNLQSSWKRIDGYSFHYYTGYKSGGAPQDHTDAEWDEVINKTKMMQNLIDRHWNIIKAYDMDGSDQGGDYCSKLVIDEWGCWYPDGTGPTNDFHLYEQQSSIRDAVVTAINLNIFNNNADKVKMANVAQLVNNLHCLFLSHNEHCITTPTYHVFDLFKTHQGATAIKTICDNENISVSASVKDEKTTLTIVNTSCTEDIQLTLDAFGKMIPNVICGKIIYHDDIHAHNTFETPNNVSAEDIVIDATKPFSVPRATVISLIF